MTSSLRHDRSSFNRIIATGGMGEVWAAPESAEDPGPRARFAGQGYGGGAGRPRGGRG